MWSSKAARISLVVAACFAVTAVGNLTGPIADADSAPAPQSWHFTSSGLDGAGFQNVIAASPFPDRSGARAILVGADIAGIHRSLDDGRTWTPSDRGLGDQHVASLLWSRQVPGKVYAAAKDGIRVSTDFGQNWVRRAGTANFDANGSYQVRPGEEHPRATGRLIEQPLTGSGPLWVGTATQGVKRSADDGTTWQRVALAGQHIRAIRLDQENADVLYVAVAHVGVLVSRNARTDMTFSVLPGSPTLPEEMTTVPGGDLYVAAHVQGVFHYDGSWHSLAAGLPPGAAWESIVAYRTSAGTVLYAGCTNVQDGRAVMKSTNGGQTWTSITSGPNVTVSPLVYGSTHPWWGNSLGYLRFASRSYVVSQLILDPLDDKSVLIAGRGGVWRGTQNGVAVTWWPAMKGLMVTVNMSVAADPGVAGRFFIGSMDFTSFASVDFGAQILHTQPADAPSTGDVITVDPVTPAGTPSPVYLGASRRGGNTGDGGVWSSADPIRGTWQSEHLPVDSDVTALGVGHPASGRVILAGVSAKGLWRKAGTQWSRVTGVAPFQNSSTGSFAWVRGGAIVYAADSVGVWRSGQAGVPGSWVKLMNARTDYRLLNAIAVDPADSGTVYVSDKSLGGLWRIQGADTAQPNRQRILSLRIPGPIVIGPTGALFVHDAAASRLLRSPAPRQAVPSFSTVSDSFYADNNHGIRSIAIGPDGTIYTAANHAGVTVGVPD